MGCLFTFTFFAALSTSFYCCEKRKKNGVANSNQSFLSESNGQQKLLFPNVPLAVYPTTHSIFQQEQNEVVESLSPAYRELPSTHLTYPSTYDSTVSVDQTLSETNDSSNQHLTTLPNSSQSSCKYHTNSLSSEQRDNTANQSTVISISDYTCDPLSSQSAPGLDSESSLSIHVASSQNPKACMTSSTSGILSGDDLTIEEKTIFSKNKRCLSESPGIGCDQREKKDNEDNSSNGMWNKLLKENVPPTRSARLLPEKRSRSSNWGLSREKQHPQPQTRSYSEGTLLTSNRGYLAEKEETNERTDNKRAITDCKDSCGIYKDELTHDKGNFKRKTAIHDSSRGASSFGDNRFISLDNPNGTTLPNYYALTFCREASFLSDKDDSDSCLRGASVLGIQTVKAKAKISHSTRRGLAVEPNEGRGASAFDMKPKSKRPGHELPWDEKNQTTPKKHEVNTNFPKTLTSACPDSQKYNNLCKPITNVEYEPRDQEPMRVALNDTYKITGSERGASELGGNSFSQKCYDNDTLCESVSLSFAYESASEDEMASNFTSPAD